MRVGGGAERGRERALDQRRRRDRRDGSLDGLERMGGGKSGERERGQED